MSVLFPVTVSVSIAAALLLLFKGRIAKRYGFGIIYILCDTTDNPVQHTASRSARF